MLAVLNLKAGGCGTGVDVAVGAFVFGSGLNAFELILRMWMGLRAFIPICVPTIVFTIARFQIRYID